MVILIAQLVRVVMIIRLGVIGNAKIVAHSGVGVAVPPFIVTAHKKPTPVSTSVVTAKLAGTKIQMDTLEGAPLARQASSVLLVQRVVKRLVQQERMLSVVHSIIWLIWESLGVPQTFHALSATVIAITTDNALEH